VVYSSITKRLETTDNKKESWYTNTSADSDWTRSKTMRALHNGAALIDNRDPLIVSTTRSSDRQQGLSDGKDILFVWETNVAFYCFITDM
jgi:hypothetical protein